MEINHHVLWLWAKEALNFNNKKLLRLIAHCGSIESVYECNDFSDVTFLTEQEKALLKKKNLRSAWEIYGDCEEHQIAILTPDDPHYPALLREISNPPSPIFFKGHLIKNLEKPTLTVVGTRRYNGYGEEKTKEIVTALCHCGFTIITGVAEGIDRFAYESAVAADSGPIVVLPFGLLSTMGASTKGFPDILRYGSILSETFPRKNTHRYSYHERNRILSGLSLGTFIPQAPKRSGAIMTANYACEQNRDLFVLLNNVCDSAEGSNALIKDGSYVVGDYTDILRVYLPQFKDELKELLCPAEKIFSLQDELTQSKLDAYRTKHKKDLNENERIIFNLITTEEIGTDDLIESSGLPVHEVLQILTTLEFKGLIISCPGGKFKVIL